MTDIHSHVIPLVDDGSKGISDSIQMIKKAYESGVRSIFCTPHFRKPYTRSVESITRHYEELKEELKKENIPVDLYLGQEIYAEDNIVELLEEGKVLTMNGTKYVLVEFDFIIPCDISETVYRLKKKGYIPIVAHVERYDYVSIDDVYDIKLNGGLIQINAGSILGEPRGVNKKFVKQLFKEGFVDFVASDIHQGRENYLGLAYQKVKKKFGEDAAEVVFNVNAKALLKVRR